MRTIIKRKRKTEMKKKILIIGLIAAMSFTTVFAMTGCTKKAYDYDLSEYVKVGNYKNLEYSKVSVSVTDDEIQKEIQTRLQNAATTESQKTGTVADGDTINVSYVGKIDGKTFDGGSADSSDITIGTTSMIDGFTDGLIGKKVGSKVTLNLTFPKDYSNTDVAGKDVVFVVTINSKQVSVVPEYNTAFIKANSDYDNKTDYEASVKKDLLATKKSDAENDILNDLWTQVIDNSKALKYPDEELQAEEKTLAQQYKDQADNYGIKWATFLKEYMGYDSEAAFNKAIKKYAKKAVFQKMVMYSIARTEDIEISDKDYKNYLADLLKGAGFTEDTFKSSYGETIEQYGEENDFRTSYQLQKVCQKIKSYGKEVATKSSTSSTSDAN